MEGFTQWNVVNPDADNPETSPYGQNFMGTESRNGNIHCVHDYHTPCNLENSLIQTTNGNQGVRISEVPLYDEYIKMNVETHNINIYVCISLSF